MGLFRSFLRSSPDCYESITACCGPHLPKWVEVAIPMDPWIWRWRAFARCYETNRRASINDVVDARPGGGRRARGIMATRKRLDGTVSSVREGGLRSTAGQTSAAAPSSPISTMDPV